MLISTLQVYGASSSVYDFTWLDKDKEVYVLQNRKFRKDSKIYVSTTVGRNINKTFIDGTAITLRGGFFFHEDWGVELVYSMNSGEENSTAKAVIDQNAVPFYRKTTKYMGAMALWSPFYSKLNLFNKIFYYDILLGAGLGNVTQEDNRKEFNVGGSKQLTSESLTGPMWTAGMRFYITPNWSTRFDVTATHVNAEAYEEDGTTFKSAGKIWWHNYDLSVGINYTF